MSTLVAHFTLFTLNRTTTPFSPLHDVQQRTLLYHISSAVSMCTATPGTPCFCTTVLYLPCTACHPPVQTCASFCLRSRSFHVTPLFPFEVADPRSHHSPRSDHTASHKRSLLHAIRISAIGTTHIQSILHEPPGQCRLFLSSVWTSLPALLVVCLISTLLPHLATFIYPVTCIPYIVSSIDLHLKSAFCN
jgi:hypothetical protein